jgi:hypothetical protein
VGIDWGSLKDWMENKSYVNFHGFGSGDAGVESMTFATTLVSLMLLLRESAGGILKKNLARFAVVFEGIARKNRPTLFLFHLHLVSSHSNH